MTAEEQFAEIRGMLKTLAVTVVAHDNQIGALIKTAEKHDAQIVALAEQVAKTEKQWQAYITTPPRQ